MEEKKSENIILLDLNKISDITDYFIIGTGTSDRMLRSLQNSVTEVANQKYSMKGTVDGKAENGWVAIDFGSIIIHLFGPEQRAFYQLEKLWERGRTLLIVK